MPIPKAVARFNRYVTNPLARLVAGWMPPFAIVHHAGRVTGRVRRTPVWAFETDDGFVVALTYGADSDWVRNVAKAGGCRLRRAGSLIPVTEPRVVLGNEGMRLVPIIVRGPLRVLGVWEFLRLSTPPRAGGDR